MQTVLKPTLPGVPDIYQGAELWDFSLVDPDNRRAVDYGRRAKCLEELGEMLQAKGSADLAPLLSNWQDGRFKMAVIAALLTFRRDNPDIFTNGGYQPVLRPKEKKPMRSARFCAAVAPPMLVATSRFPTRREKAAAPKAHLNLPPALSGRRWRNLLSREEGESLPPKLATAALLKLPAAVLVTL